MWERVAKAFDDLKKRQVHIGELAAKQMPAAAVRQHPLEVVEELRHSILQEIGCAPLRFTALVLVVKPGRDRVVGIVNLDQQVGDRKLQLMRPQSSGITARRKAVTHAEEEKDIRRLANEELAAPEERRREWRMLDALAVEKRHHRRHAAALGRLARHIDVWRAHLLERDTHKFATPLDFRPVV